MQFSRRTPQRTPPRQPVARLVALLSAAAVRARGWLRRRAPERAAGTLLPHLRHRDPRTAPHDPKLLAVCLTYLRTHSHDPQMPLRAWAQYAYDASRHLHGPDHADTLAAGQALAAELDFDRDHGAASVVRQALIDSYTHIDDHLEALRVRFDLGCTLHALGRCDEGVTAARQAWQEWEAVRGVDPVGLSQLIIVAAMLRGCYRTADAAPLIDLARQRVQASVAAFDSHDRVYTVAGLLALQPLALEDHPSACTYHAANPADPGNPRQYTPSEYRPLTVYDLL
ncbi:hypothetical protein AB0H83_23285 [Dactylosporangium sp. NPDC050688]|uniref:hypothetical protein n=1 Tax=Dactylosporangium sp. NPDC050688 TaxID=3157217 RepID=UPI0033FEF647